MVNRPVKAETPGSTLPLGAVRLCTPRRSRTGDCEVRAGNGGSESPPALGEASPSNLLTLAGRSGS